MKPIISDLKSEDYIRTIIFFNNKSLCGETYEIIESEVGAVDDESVVQIHADLGRSLKEKTFRAILAGHVKLILATNSDEDFYAEIS